MKLGTENLKVKATGYKLRLIKCSMVLLLVFLLPTRSSAQHSKQLCVNIDDVYYPMEIEILRPDGTLSAPNQSDADKFSEKSKLIRCSNLAKNRLSENSILFYYDKFVSRDLNQRVLYEIPFVSNYNGEICREIPSISLRFRGISAYDFLEKFHMRGHAANFSWKSDKIGGWISRKCGTSPEAYRVQVFVEGADSPEFPSGLVFSGLFSVNPRYGWEWLDDRPWIRQEVARNYRKERTAYINAMVKRRREQEEFYGSIASFTVGLIQGVALEFGDESVCAFMSSLSLDGLQRSEYERCHNQLNDMIAGLQEGSPGFYLIGNILGMMHTSFDQFTEEQDTREAEAARIAMSEFLECILAEHGKLRIGESIDEQTLAQACTFAFALGGAKGFVLPSQK